MKAAPHDAELGSMDQGIPDEHLGKDMLVRVHAAADRMSNFGPWTSVRIDVLAFDESGPFEHRNICEHRRFIAGMLAERFRLGLPYLACKYTEMLSKKSGTLVKIVRPLPQETDVEREIVASLRRAAISLGWDLDVGPS